MASCRYDMPRSACSVALQTYHGASTIILRILDWLYKTKRFTCLWDLNLRIWVRRKTGLKDVWTQKYLNSCLKTEVEFSTSCRT
jgi:hypothetical protein